MIYSTYLTIVNYISQNLTAPVHSLIYLPPNHYYIVYLIPRYTTHSAYCITLIGTMFTVKKY